MSRLPSRLLAVATDDRRARARRLLETASRSYIVIILLGIVIGLQVAPVVSQVASQPVSGSVAVVTLSGSIDGNNAASVADRLRQARQDPDVEAVVLLVNSPGGGASASETLYLAVKRTAAQMPVVASVDAMAASGGYYAAVPSDEIFVKPSSLIGSVGVFFTVPQDVDPLDELITSGPNKLTGAEQREWFYKTESIRRAFTGAVVESRGDQLGLSAEELSYAKLYTGAEAVDNGMADRIGGLDAAIRHAASMANLPRWSVRTLAYTGPVTFVTRSAYVASSAQQKVLVDPQYLIASSDESVAPTIVMLPPSIVQAAVAGEVKANVTTPAR